jgi:hypothetical protein
LRLHPNGQRRITSFTTMIAIKSRIARWIAGRLGGRARALRRSLRDYQRHEYSRIFQLERRARGLRLYAAWTQKTEAIPIREAPEDLPLPRVTFHDNMKAAA